MVLTMNGDLQRQRAIMASRPARRESDARRDLERMHLQTIRKEKMRLQQELDRVRVKGQYIVGRKHMKTTSKNARLLSERLGKSTSDLHVEQSNPGTRLEVATDFPRSISPHNARIASAGPGHSKDRELPQIGMTPLTAEVEMRRHIIELRDPNTKLNELRMNQGRQQNLLSLKIDQFTRSLTPVTPTRTPTRSPVPPSSPVPDSKPNVVEDIEMRNSSGSDSRGSRHGADVDLRASFPPHSKKKWQPTSMAERDVKHTKQSKRLLPVDSEHDINVDIAVGSRPEDILPPIPSTAAHPPPPTRRPTIIRRQSQAAILERTESKINKYAPMTDSTQNANKRSVESELNLSVLGRDARRVKEIIENPEIVFDQHKYAPDGALRTLHMLPTADDAFSQARKARYLRWRDPKELERERELSLSDIFGKDKK